MLPVFIRKVLLVMALGLLLTVPLHARTELVRPDYSQTSGIAPAYFGPNAFPVPEMLDGRVSPEFQVEMAGDFYSGHLDASSDLTGDFFIKALIPLYSQRVNLSLWMPVIEYYSFSETVRDIRRVSPPYATRGHEFGDVYVGIDIQLLEDNGKRPDFAIRSVLKSASGGSFAQARYYDCPGYFFDAAVGKNFALEPNRLVQNIRLSASTGFLCWQTDNGRQNDAVMYGLQIGFNGRQCSLNTTFSGYSGWENDGDRPMTLKTRLLYHGATVKPFILYESGLHDFPFDHWRLGLQFCPLSSQVRH